MGVEKRSAGWLPALFMLLVYGGCHVLSLWLFRQSWMSQHGPNGDPPWYFIGGDIINGLVLGGGLAVVAVASLLLRRRDAEGSWIALLMGMMFMGYPTGQGVYAIARSSALWSAEEATTAWASHEEYDADPLRYAILVACWAGAATLAFGARNRWVRVGAAEQGDAADERAPSSQPPVRS